MWFQISPLLSMGLASWLFGSQDLVSPAESPAELISTSQAFGHVL